MRFIVPVIAAALMVIAASLTPSFAAAKKGATPAEPVMQTFNNCVDLAKKRGFSAQDLEGDGDRASARKFVMNCMQGKQR